jgi:hypothetical protein
LVPTRLIGSVLLILLSTAVGAALSTTFGGEPVVAREQASVQQPPILADQQVATVEQENSTIQQQVTIQQQQVQIAALNATVQQLQLSRPTYEELQAFLASDRTNQRSPSDPSYVCLNFAHDLKTAAASHGLNMSFVVANIAVQVVSKSSGQSSSGILILQPTRFAHAFNSVMLQDGRTVYVEPQNDKIFLDEKSLIKAKLEEMYPSSNYTIHGITIEDTVFIW